MRPQQRHSNINAMTTTRLLLTAATLAVGVLTVVLVPAALAADIESPALILIHAVTALQL
jgi:hypothetical protein